MKSLAIVIPLYKSKSHLELLIQRLNEWNKCDLLDFSKKVIFVEDGSDDGTYETLLQLQSTISFSFVAIRLVKNVGQHSAIAVGLAHTNEDIVIVMDDDLQHDPFEIKQLVNSLVQSNADLVYGKYSNKNHHFFRNFSSNLLKLITKSKQVDFSKVTSFKAMRQSTLSIIKKQTNPIVLVDVYLMESASKIEECLVSHNQRVLGKSTYSNVKLMKMTFNILLFHSSFTLKMITRLGLSMSLFFLLMSCYYIYQKIMNDVEMGFTTLIVAIFLSTGLILFSLGIIGEYIRKIWVNQQQLETVLIAEKYDSERF